MRKSMLFTAWMLMAATASYATDYANCTVTGFADRVDVRYESGEEMVFTFQLLENRKPAAGTLRVTRSGDDGKTETVKIGTAPDKPAVYRTSLGKPGFVMVKADLVDRDGNAVSRVWDKRSCRVQFGLGACVKPETLKQGIPEPADFDAFWAGAKQELAAVPPEVLEKKLISESGVSRVYDMKIACAGNRPVSGYLAIPKEAKPGSLPLKLHFHGYGVAGARITESADAIHFYVNAHGIENGREKEYYDGLARGELKSYGFDNEKNRKPDSCYFKNMILRDLRALEFGRSLSEWNGRDIFIQGGSHGAFQAAAVAALAGDVSACELDIPWLCDLGGVNAGRLRGWRPDYAPGLGYFDTVNFAARIKCPVKIITAGLSDWVCPPSGVWVLFNNLAGPAEMTTSQGYDHAPYPGFNPRTAPRFTYRKP